MHKVFLYQTGKFPNPLIPMTVAFIFIVDRDTQYGIRGMHVLK